MRWDCSNGLIDKMIKEIEEEKKETRRREKGEEDKIDWRDER